MLNLGDRVRVKPGMPGSDHISKMIGIIINIEEIDPVNKTIVYIVSFSDTLLGHFSNDWLEVVHQK